MSEQLEKIESGVSPEVQTMIILESGALAAQIAELEEGNQKKAEAFSKVFGLLTKGTLRNLELQK